MKHLCWLLAIGCLGLGQGLQAQRLSRQYTFGYNQNFPFDMIGRNHIVWAAYKHYLKKGLFVGLRADYHMEEADKTLSLVPSGSDWYHVTNEEERFALAGAVPHDDLDPGLVQFKTRDWRDTDIYLNLMTGYTFAFWQDRLNLSLLVGGGLTYSQTMGFVSSNSAYTVTDADLPPADAWLIYPAYKRGLNASPLAGFEFAYLAGPWLLGLNAVFNPQASTIITHGLLVGRQF
jgi:hypothetical protein